MRIKTVVQILLLVLILAIFYLFYFLYFKKNNLDTNKINENETIKIEAVQTEEEEQEILDENKENTTNIIKNIEYKSSDRSGNEYILRAEIGEIDLDNKNIITLNKVTGSIMLLDKNTINIYSNLAIYNTENSDTKFFDKVKIQFEDNIINSEKFDLYIDENTAKIYDDVVFNNNLTKVNADIINIDLMTGNIVVDMYDKSNKVKFLKK
tara:strand:- start:195 stop:821 length:627 start_codon:yes stop_codon:yes gene_type:complete